MNKNNNIEFPTQNTSKYRRYVDAHFIGYTAAQNGPLVVMPDFKDEAQRLGFKAGWHMGCLPQDRKKPGYWSQHLYWVVWDEGKEAWEVRGGGRYNNPYNSGSWRWRAYLAGWSSRGYRDD